MPDPRLVDAVELLMRAAIGVTTGSLAEAGGGSDLTLQQWRAVVVVVESGGNGIRVGALGARLGMAPPGASRLVRRLERRGLVVLSRPDGDRRTAVVRTSLAGLGLWEEVVRRRRVHIGEALDGRLAGGEAEAARVVELLATAFGGV